MSEIVFLFSDTGGGHRTAAQAVAQALEMEHPGTHRIALQNAIGLLPAPFNRSEETYASAARTAPWLHRLSYEAINGATRMKMLGGLGMALDGDRARAWAQTCAADVVVSCQPHFNAFIPQALRRAGSRAKYAHIVTDLLHVHAFHFAPEIDLLIVPNAEVKAEAVRSGIPESRIFVGGYPIMPDFERQIKDLTGLGQNNATKPVRSGGAPQLLLMGGGEGMGQLRDLARALMRSDLRASLTVVCGRNTALQDELLAETPRMPTQILGFTDNIPQLMAASHVLISKAGTGTLCEGLAAGLPIILYHAVPGQEDGNRAYLAAHKAAAWCPSIPKVMAQLEAWLSDEDERQRAACAARGLANPQAAVEIARKLALAAA